MDAMDAMDATDRSHRIPRVWSNRELARFAHLFRGAVVNVSGWTDSDKEGRCYREYFSNAESYTLTNFDSDKKGFLGLEGEIFLDLEKPLASELQRRFDVVFNHTTLEHIYEVSTAFSTLCEMSRDIVIVVVPFLQQYHSHYGDYWRFSPLAVRRMFEERGFSPLHISFNSDPQSSVYVLAIATRYPDSWSSEFSFELNVEDPLGQAKQPPIKEPYIGCNAIPNTGYYFWKRRFPKKLRRWANRFSGSHKKGSQP